MSLQTLKVGIFTRWNDASLDTSIATLYPGDTDQSRAAAAGSPESTAKPRAQYHVSESPPVSKTRASRVLQGAVLFSVWGSTSEAVDGYLTSISTAFINADQAGTPLAISGATVLDVNDSGSSNMKEDDDTHRGDITFIIDYRIENVVPA